MGIWERVRGLLGGHIKKRERGPPKIPVSELSSSSDLQEQFDEIGTWLAHEARRWSVEGSSSGFELLAELDHPSPASEADLQVELYALHIFAFFRATVVGFGLPSVHFCTSMLEEAPRVAASIWSRAGGREVDGGVPRMKTLISEAIADYGAARPDGGTPKEFLEFGRVAIQRLFKSDVKDPALAILFVQMYQAARQSCHDMIEEGLVAMDVPAAWIGREL
jgi:hypothetical protein